MLSFYAAFTAEEHGLLLGIHAKKSKKKFSFFFHLKNILIYLYTQVCSWLTFQIKYCYVVINYAGRVFGTARFGDGSVFLIPNPANSGKSQILTFVKYLQYFDENLLFRLRNCLFIFSYFFFLTSLYFFDARRSSLRLGLK